MIIEIIGLPGSRKSTKARELVQNSDAEIIKINNIFYRAFYLLKYFFKKPLHIYFWKWMIFKEGNLSLYRYLYHLWWVAFAKYEKASCYSGVAIIDEGPIQRILSVLSHKASVGEIEKILRHTPLPDTILASRGGSFERFLEWQRKESSPRMKGGEEKFRQWQEVITHNYAVLIQVLEKNHTDRLRRF